MPIPILGALIPSLIAAGSGLAAQGIAAGIEGRRPENRMSPDEWLRHKGMAEAGRAGEIAALQGAATGHRGAVKDLGKRAGYRLGGMAGDAVSGTLMPAFRRAVRQSLLSEGQRQSAREGAAMEEKAGLMGASKQRQAILAQIASMGAKAVGGLSEKGLEGTDLEGLGIGAIGSGLVGGAGALGMGVDAAQRRRAEGVSGGSRPLFGGGSGYGLYGYGGLYG